MSTTTNPKAVSEKDRLDEVRQLVELAAQRFGVIHDVCRQYELTAPPRDQALTHAVLFQCMAKEGFRMLDNAAAIAAGWAFPPMGRFVDDEDYPLHAQRSVCVEDDNEVTS